MGEMRRGRKKEGEEGGERERERVREREGRSRGKGREKERERGSVLLLLSPQLLRLHTDDPALVTHLTRHSSHAQQPHTNHTREHVSQGGEESLRGGENFRRPFCRPFRHIVTQEYTQRRPHCRAGGEVSRQRFEWVRKDTGVSSMLWWPEMGCVGV